MNLEYWYVFPSAVVVCICATSSGFSGAVLFQPFFYFVLQLPVPNSIATGIATETIGMTGAAYRYARMGYHDWAAWKILLPWALLGVLVGLFVFVRLPPAPLKALVGLSMLLVATVQMVSVFLPRRGHRLGTARWSPLALVAGAFSASTGTGVAEMTQPLLEHRSNLPTKRANATAILLEASADWLITLFNLSIGFIRWDVLVFSVSGVLLGSQIGPRLAPRMPDALVKVVFSISVACIGAFYVWSYARTLLS